MKQATPKIKKTSTPQEVKVRGLVWGAFGNGDNCTGIVERIDNTENGIFTKYMGVQYLFKGYPDVRMVDAIMSSKRMISGLFFLIVLKPIRLFLGMVFVCFLILPKTIKKKIIISLFDYFTDVGYVGIHKVVFPPDKYCKSVKELHQAIEAVYQKIGIDKWSLFGVKTTHSESLAGLMRKARDIICMQLEGDYAYRARWQDVLQYLSKAHLKRDTKAELNRIFKILISREVNDYQRRKWVGMAKIISYLLKIKSVRKFIVDLLMELDYNKIKPDEADWYYNLDRVDYLFGGLSYPERMEISKELDKKMNNQRPRILFKEKVAEK